MRIETSYFCETGMVRRSNQDTVFLHSGAPGTLRLFLVADGMGGYANGGKASQAIADGMADWLSHNTEGEQMNDILNSAQERLQMISDKIRRTWGQEQHCGSTCVLLLLLERVYGLLSVGDSRVYLHRGFSCELLTTDDVWEKQESVRSRFTEEEMRRQPEYGRLVHAVGTEDVLCCSMQTGILRRGDTFALCSDGVYRMCGEPFLRRTLYGSRFFRLDTLRDRIRSEVYRRGAKDNFSLILVRCS